MSAYAPGAITFPALEQGKLHVAALQAFARILHPSSRPHTRFWTDPYIATQMLAAHLDPVYRCASRRPTTIDAEVGCLSGAQTATGRIASSISAVGRVSYSMRLAAQGLGCDWIGRFLFISRLHARRAAQERGLSIDFRAG